MSASARVCIGELRCLLLAAAMVFASLAYAFATAAAAPADAPPTRATPAPSSTLDRPLATLSHSSLTPRDGAPTGITSFAQTSDGFLWIGTHYGLYQFDGIRFQPQASDQLQSSHIHALWADANGDLWIGFSTAGVSRLHAGQVSNYLGEGLPSGTAFAITRTNEGTLWVATTFGLARRVGETWQPVGEEFGLPVIRPELMHAAADGALWVEAGEHTYRLAPGSTHFETLGREDFLQSFGLPQGSRPPHRTGIAAMMVDSSGALWEGYQGGIERFRRPAQLTAPETAVAEKIDPGTTLTGMFVGEIFEDREANVWVGTNGGLDRFRQNRLNVVHFDERIYQPAIVAGDHGDIWLGNTWKTGYHITDSAEPAPAVPAMTSLMAREADGSLWMGGTAGLMRLLDGHATPFDLPADLAHVGFRFQALARQDDGSLWLSMSGLGLRRYKDGVWSVNGDKSTLPTDQNPLALANGRDGRLWLGYSRNRLCAIAREDVHCLDASSRIDVGAIQVISANTDALWIGGERGVQVQRGNAFTTLTGEGDETFPDISGIVPTPAGDLWLNGAFGLYRIRGSELQLGARDPDYRVVFDHFTARDGLDGPAVQIRPTPTLIQGSDGRLWAATESGVVWVDPEAMPSASAAPVPVIQSIEANGESYRAVDLPTLPKGSKSLRINYTAPVLGAPERVRFRYRLLGFSPDWEDVGERRVAFFTNLAPAAYTFQVQAKLDGAQWGEQRSESTFSLAPNFYQTRWFYALLVLLTASLLWAIHVVRLRRLSVRLRIRRHERERVARDLHDTLLQSVQGLILHVHVASNCDQDAALRQRLLNEAVTTAQATLKEGRDKVMELRDRSNGSFELAEAVRRFVVTAPPTFTGAANVVVAGNPTPLRPSTQDELFSIVREMVVNVWRHADASVIDVSLRYGWWTFIAEVCDNGLGVPATIERGATPTGRWGIVGMKERARQLGGVVSIKRGVHGGTLAQLRVRARRVYQH